MRNFPAHIVPSGWYMIGWSTDFPALTAKPLSYFGHELVAYRGQSGQLVLLDAYCRHMGAHLGYGGCVEGDSIRCPYHGWLWGPDGANTEIPYSAPDKMGRLKIRKWRVHEVDDIVLTYYSNDGSEPLYDPPEQIVTFEGEAFPIDESSTKMWLEQKFSPQYMAENAADAAHFKYVHRSAEVASLNEFTVDGGVFRARLDLTFGGHAETTWATPNGPVDGYIVTENWGLGLGIARLHAFDDVVYLMGITPTSPYTADMRSTTWASRKRADGSLMSEKVRDKWVQQQNHQVDQDLKIWNHLSYVERTPWALSESMSMRALRGWAKQFYPAEAAAGRPSDSL